MGKKGRVFVRGLTSETYGLGEFRREQLAVERVRDDSFVVDDAKVAHSGDSEKSRTWWRIGPGVLRAEINELLTRTGPGTPMGDLFRQYWMPAMLAEELPENDCPPVRVKLLSERMVAFRDSDGRYGLIDEFCAHRGASLWFGRNEGSGLRCPYHGWKYDVTGQAIEVPSEPENSTFCAHVKLTSYPLVKIGDVLWTYMGDPEKQPPLPEFEFATGRRPSRPTPRSGGRSATGCRPSKAASTPATCRSCTPAG